MLLSLCMIVKNEEKNLIRCLESVKDIVDEMIIVDTGSTDATVKIAESYGAHVYFFEWNDNFSDARNFSISKANGDWIFIMDADDELKASDKEKVLPLLHHEGVDIYLFQTLSYVGKAPCLDAANNLFVRLIRNHKGYGYEGAIHEQIRQNQDAVDISKVKAANITIFHYGYIENKPIEQCKSKRNIKILERLLAEDPEDNFHLFNMGNEYLRLRNYHKALHYYLKAYENFNPSAAHSSKLLARTVIALDASNRYEKEMEIIDLGLKHYPNFTDLVFLKASMLHKQKKYLLAIIEFHNCLVLKDPPPHLQFIHGVGGYKSHFALGECYFELEDYDQAYHHYVEAMKANSNYYIPLYRIINVLFKKGKDLNTIKRILEGFFGEKINAPSYQVLGDILFTQEKYADALEYFLKAEDIAGSSSSRILYYKGMCRFFLKNYQAAFNDFYEINRNYLHYEKAICFMFLCKTFTKDVKYSEKLLDTIKGFKNKQIHTVYKTFYDLMEDKKCSPISNSKEESNQFIDIIFTLLKDVLKGSTPEIFEKSLQLLNLVENDEVLLRLAKLYYLNGYYSLAYYEFIRTIKIFDRIDVEGLDMMKNILESLGDITI